MSAVTQATPMEEHEMAERTCAGCRQRDAREALVRFVLGPDGRPVADVSRRLPGRGVSVHPRRACLETAAHRGGMSRGFRRAVDADPDVLAGQVTAQLRRRLEGLLIAARRSKLLVVGTEAVRARMRERPPALLLVARDAAGRRDELVRSAERLGERCLVSFDKTELGRLFGRDEVGVVAITDRGIAEEVVRAAAAISAIAEEG